MVFSVKYSLNIQFLTLKPWLLFRQLQRQLQAHEFRELLLQQHLSCLFNLEPLRIILCSCVMIIGQCDDHHTVWWSSYSVMIIIQYDDHHTVRWSSYSAMIIIQCDEDYTVWWTWLSAPTLIRVTFSVLTASVTAVTGLLGRGLVVSSLLVCAWPLPVVAEVQADLLSAKILSKSFLAYILVYILHEKPASWVFQLLVVDPVNSICIQLLHK